MDRDMAMSGQADRGAMQELQLVVFDLAAEYNGVDIGDVRRSSGCRASHGYPSPDHVEGVINLRGKVVPVLDLRKRLNRRINEQTKESRIVVVNIGSSDVGVIVDAVTEVLRVPVAAIEPPSSMITDAESDYLRGIAKLETKLIILLDLNKALASVRMSGLDTKAEAEADRIAGADITTTPKATAPGNNTGAAPSGVLASCHRMANRCMQGGSACARTSGLREHSGQTGAADTPQGEQWCRTFSTTLDEGEGRETQRGSQS
jgi:purine-binding chemotaxis protein CheW